MNPTPPDPSGKRTTVDDYLRQHHGLGLEQVKSALKVAEEFSAWIDMGGVPSTKGLHDAYQAWRAARP